ncbi:hypothetical protein [Clostridium ganghwense]|uniref:Lipoprotein n=1 Tax=Clostridium ganghwense TaxID=312089 RepID=A0ABT4CNL7_9CLOT|nr:hypothetical protein [Clostridium ganghwense]MCY6370650.1 hypothetical protein [Clostridium ganghwense]
MKIKLLKNLGLLSCSIGILCIISDLYYVYIFMDKERIGICHYFGFSINLLILSLIGIILAIIGLLKTDGKKTYFILGFILNLLPFTLLPFIQLML